MLRAGRAHVGRHVGRREAMRGARSRAWTAKVSSILKDRQLRPGARDVGWAYCSFGPRAQARGARPKGSARPIALGYDRAAPALINTSACQALS